MKNHPSESKRRLSPAALAAVLISVFALTVALSSTATAALMVGSNQIKKNAVKSKHIAKNAVTTKDIKNGTIKPVDLSAAARDGMTGEQGEKGEKGDKGDRGLTGFGLQGPKGDPGISGYQQVTKTWAVPAASSPGNPGTLSADIDCPSGTTVLSGGFGGASNLEVTHNRPYANSTTRWLLAVENHNSTVVTLKGYAMCAVVAP